jgi:hypothetical protein
VVASTASRWAGWRSSSSRSRSSRTGCNTPKG